eukprot:TRINITY_DN511_c0_g2_i1.p1 TRINITY_DN511_c0_g2~~TRINITY_DN511_c0_g2_i1.p1  ORF type:complete len:137 (+),score=39.42 TRINITY_DN511_c0_g2_i1:152-562(+)
MCIRDSQRRVRGTRQAAMEVTEEAPQGHPVTTNESSSGQDDGAAILAEQEKLAAAKYGTSLGKNPVSAFNRREKMKRFDSADWMMEKSGTQSAHKTNLLQRANQGQLHKLNAAKQQGGVPNPNMPEDTPPEDPAPQ